MIQQKILAPSKQDLQKLEVLERELELALARADSATVQQILVERDALMAEAALRPLQPGEF